MANFPTSAPNLKTDYEDNVDDVLADNQNTPNEEINAIASKIGTGASTPASNKLFRGTGAGTSAWDIDLDTDVTLAGNSDTRIPSQKAVKAYGDRAYISTLNVAPLYTPQGFLLNGKIVPSVTSNNLTVALKTLAGTDPSTSNPVHIRIGDTIRTITSALSVTKNAGTNWCNSGSSKLATKEIDYFVYLGYNATDGVTIGFSRIPYGTQYGNFSATTTNEKYCAISTITNATSTDYYENVGRFASTLSAGAGYTWSVPTFTADNLIQRPIYETRWLSIDAKPFGDSGSLGSYSEDNVSQIYKINNNTLLYKNIRRLSNKGSWSGALRVPFPISVSDTNYSSLMGNIYAQGGLTLKAVSSSVQDNMSFHSDFAISTYQYTSLSNNDFICIDFVGKIL